jgi:hypothetical protein
MMFGKKINKNKKEIKTNTKHTNESMKLNLVKKYRLTES